MVEYLHIISPKNKGDGTETKSLTTCPDSSDKTSSVYLPRENDGHFYWLDLIRFIAALLVVAGHYRDGLFVDFYQLHQFDQTFIISVFYLATRFGFEAVVIFFVLSGFLVGGKAIDRILKGTFSPLQYGIDRAVRIMLPLISALLLYLPICLVFNIPINLFDWIGSLFSLQGILCSPPIGPLWSLSYEVWFYIFMLAIGYTIKHNGTRQSLIGLSVLLIVFMVFTKLEAYYLFIWLIGALGIFTIKYKSKRILIFSLLFSALSLAILQITAVPRNGISFSPLFRHNLVLCFSFTFVCFLTNVIQLKPKYNWEVKLNVIGTKLAAFSYTLYLTHIPILLLLKNIGFKEYDTISLISMLQYGVGMLIAIIVAYLIYLCFEKNTSKIKNMIRIKIFNTK